MTLEIEALPFLAPVPPLRSGRDWAAEAELGRGMEELRSPESYAVCWWPTGGLIQYIRARDVIDRTATDPRSVCEPEGGLSRSDAFAKAANRRNSRGSVSGRRNRAIWY